LTNAKYRLHDGTNQYYWNGAAWVISIANWNTEAEIATNIATYNATGTRILRVVVNLSTTDAGVTPELFGIRLAYEADLPSVQDDLIYRTLVRKLKSGIRPVTDFYVKSDGASTVNLGTKLVADKSPFNVVDVDAIYNQTDDPKHDTSILSSYDPVTKIATLSSAQTIGDVLLFRCIYAPVVTFEATHPDFIQLESIPAIVLTNLNSFRSGPLAQRDIVADKSIIEGIIFDPPYRTNFKCSITIAAPGAVDGQRLADTVQDYFEQNTLMSMYGTDEQFKVKLIEAFRSATTPSEEPLYTGSSVLELLEVNFYRRKALKSDMDGVYPVGAVVLTTNRA